MSFIQRKVGLLLCALFLLGPVSYADGNDQNKSIGTAAGRFIDLILSDSGVVTALGKSGIRGESATQVKNFVNLSLKALNLNNAKPTKREFIKALQSLPSSGTDGRIKKQLFTLLNKKESELTKGEFVETINNLIYLANRYGRNSSTILACSACVNSNLSESGFKFTMQVLENKQAKAILEGLPTKPADLRKHISSQMRDLKLGSFFANSSQVAPEEEKALALFLGMAKYGSKAQQELANEILSVSSFSRSKKVFFGNKLWRLFSDNITQSETEGWAKLIKEVKKDPSYVADGDFEKALFKNFEKKAAKNSDFSDELAYLKKNNCFFDK
tara:strand:- start:22809 stop:23795 length:987 start_codon:yes stop_codon:yes gene_type:complete